MWSTRQKSGDDSLGAVVTSEAATDDQRQAALLIEGSRTQRERFDLLFVQQH